MLEQGISTAMIKLKLWTVLHTANSRKEVGSGKEDAMKG